MDKSSHPKKPQGCGLSQSTHWKQKSTSIINKEKLPKEVWIFVPLLKICGEFDVFFRYDFSYTPFKLEDASILMVYGEASEAIG